MVPEMSIDPARDGPLSTGYQTSQDRGPASPDRFCHQWAIAPFPWPAIHSRFPASSCHLHLEIQRENNKNQREDWQYLHRKQRVDAPPLVAKPSRFDTPSNPLLKTNSSPRASVQSHTCSPCLGAQNQTLSRPPNPHTPSIPTTTLMARGKWVARA